MKINRPTDERVLIPFKNLQIGDCFVLNDRLYMKIGESDPDPNAVLLQEAGCITAFVIPETRCVLVDAEISYAYRRPEETEHND